jgi:hypothetical protein
MSPPPEEYPLYKVWLWENGNMYMIQEEEFDNKEKVNLYSYNSYPAIFVGTRKYCKKTKKYIVKLVKTDL